MADSLRELDSTTRFPATRGHWHVCRDCGRPLECPVSLADADRLCRIPHPWTCTPCLGRYDIDRAGRFVVPVIAGRRP